MNKLLRNTAFLRVVFLVIALGVAGFGVMQLKSYFNSNIPTQEVLVAKVDIQPYSLISINDLGYMKLPVGSVLSGSIQNYGSVVGKYSTTVIYHGEQIFPAMLGSKTDLLGANTREVAIPTDIVRSVGLEIKPGDKVDLYFLPVANTNVLNNGPKAVQQASLITQGALVVNILNGQDASVFAAVSNPTGNATTSTAAVSQNAPAVVVLRVENSAVQPIITASGNGLIYMAKSE